MKFFRVFVFTLIFVLKPNSQNASNDGIELPNAVIETTGPSLMESFINAIQLKGKMGEPADLGAKIIPTADSQSFELIFEKNNAEFYTMDVYNLIGDKLIETDYFIGEEGQKFGDDFTPGMYLVDIKSGQKVQRLKILKQ